uniref:Transmembrane protein n=1 Tax=Noccaea caerulescens TaxID=107243 RepID=A0A1J3JDI7_NOCCA
MVVSDFASGLRNIWPFSILEGSDLRESNKLVHRLSVPESTKNFVFAVRVPEHDSTIYILSAQNLSQRSASDAECLIREIRPGAVVAQVDRSAFGEAQVEESVLGDGSSDSIPTSSFRVLTQCFVDKVNKEKYESVAGILVLREIFGTSFNGHLLAAKRVAREVGSSFMVLESPFVNIAAMEASSGEIEGGGKMQGLANSLSLIPQNAGSAIVSSSRRFLITNDAQAQMLKLLSSHITQLGKELSPSRCVDSGVSNEIQFDSHEVPPFAQSIYSLLVDLHDIFIDLPSIRKSLANARKMLSDVNRGASMDTEVISEVYLFQIAVEGLRIALNNAGRLASSRRAKFQFSQLSSEDKSYALMADHLRSQAQKFKNIVAVVDASNLAGLRKHWNTCVPQEVKDMSEHMVQDFDSDESSNDSKLKRLLSDKPVVAVGAGATAIWGASSLSKAISASPFFKLLTFKAPASLNLFLTHTHKAMTFAFTKVAYPSKVMAPGLASSGAKSTSLVKASLSAEKIRAVTQSIIASAEKTSLSAMRAAFYEIMRKRRAKPIGTLPLATFGASLATCAGLLVYEEGIECAAMSLPSAPSIAKLGQGIQNLHEASLEVRRTESNRIHNAIETLRQRLKKFTLQ